uniref:uncharacterized protein LOC122581566 isoform X2 n=1 Tax=Erigeron canadensis TaxID=72917 RepID=UPI001CB93375|nr:uncharacterized protein LOC122581566 isoform X2 [Erigeron canadensis]
MEDRLLLTINFHLRRSPNPWFSFKNSMYCFSHKNVVVLDHFSSRVRARKNFKIKLSFGSSFRLVDPQLHCLACHKPRRLGHLSPFASADDSLAVNGSPQPSTTGDTVELRDKLDNPLQNEGYNSALLQSLHDVAREFESALRVQSSVSNLSWFSIDWIGVDQNAWVKTLSYQASACSLLLAACEVLSLGDRRNREINVLVQKSLSQLCATLENAIRDTLSDKKSELYEWFWSEQVPLAVSTYVNYFEDQRFADVVGINKGLLSSLVDASGKAVPIFALGCVAAITKLGPAKVSCTQFYSIVPNVNGRLMEMLLGLVSIRKAYHSIKKIGLHREFLVHFGPRAAACRVEDDHSTKEVLFWVNLVHKQLLQALGRERIWSRLSTSESIEVLNKDLAIFGFFIALGRRTQCFLCAKNFETLPEPIGGLIRYFIGGSVLYYPQLSSISSYQLYVEVVCEELDWLPFYPGVENLRLMHGHKSTRDPPSEEAIALVLDVCSHWIQSFIKYSKWLEHPSNVKAVRFLSRGHNILKKSKEEVGLPKKLMTENGATGLVEIASSRSYISSRKDLDSFDKALESVDEALLKLEKLLQKRHISSSNSGREHLKPAGSDLDKIRKLKKEAEFLEASFRAKADLLKQGNDINRSESSVSNKRQSNSSRGISRGNSNIERDKSSSNSDGLWSFLVRRPRTLDSGSPTSYSSDNTRVTETNEIQQFNLIRNELQELERRVQRSAKSSNNKEEEVNVMDDAAKYSSDPKGLQVVKVQEKENFIEKFLDRLKETTTDVLQGTQLLAIDVAAATGLLIRVLTGDELTEKEKQGLRRTLTDLASVIPIGFLMLLPVTAVGHAAMLAAIKRYIPSLIPSTYGPERLDLLRQLKKVKEMDSTDADPLTPADEP